MAINNRRGMIKSIRLLFIPRTSINKIRRNKVCQEIQEIYQRILHIICVKELIENTYMRNDFVNKTGIINKEILDLIFSSEDNYLEKFYSIEDNPKGIKIDVEDDLENFINEFVKNNSISKEDIIENKFFVKKLFNVFKNIGENLA